MDVDVTKAIVPPLYPQTENGRRFQSHPQSRWADVLWPTGENLIHNHRISARVPQQMVLCKGFWCTCLHGARSDEGHMLTIEEHLHWTLGGSTCGCKRASRSSSYGNCYTSVWEGLLPGPTVSNLLLCPCHGGWASFIVRWPALFLDMLILTGRLMKNKHFGQRNCKVAMKAVQQHSEGEKWTIWSRVKKEWTMPHGHNISIFSTCKTAVHYAHSSLVLPVQRQEFCKCTTWWSQGRQHGQWKKNLAKRHTVLRWTT